MAHSSSGLGHRPLKAEIRGSNPLCATSINDPDHIGPGRLVLSSRTAFAQAGNYGEVICAGREVRESEELSWRRLEGWLVRRRRRATEKERSRRTDVARS